MVTSILTAWQSPCNEINSTSFNNKSNNYPISAKSQMAQTGKSKQLPTNKSSCNHTNNGSLSLYSAQKIIRQFLSCNRIVFLPHIAPRFTEAELAKKLNISIAELRYLQRTPKFYQGIPKQVCLLLANLYCSTVLQQPKLEHAEGLANE